MNTDLIYGPAQNAVNSGISQVFNYGIGMTALGLFLAASVLLNVWLLKQFFKIITGITPMLAVIKEKLDDH